MLGRQELLDLIIDQRAPVWTLEKVRRDLKLNLHRASRGFRSRFVEAIATNYGGEGDVWKNNEYGWYKGRPIPLVGGGSGAAAPTLYGQRSGLFYQQVAGGLPAILDVTVFPGNVLFAASGWGSDAAGSGKSQDAPTDSLDYAVGLGTASQGDVIFVLPGHAETIAAANGVDLDIADMQVIGLGRGDNRPTLTYSATGSTVRFQAKNVSLKNFRFIGDIDSLVKFLDINKNYATIEDSEFITSSTKEALSFLNLATTFDYLTVRRCRFIQPTDPEGTDGGVDTGALYCVDSEHILYEDCWFYGAFETAIFHNRTTKCVDLWVKNCHGVQLLSGAEPFQLVADSEGAMLGGGFITPNEAAVTEATLVGTVGNKFFVLQPGAFGNDGVSGGQGGIIIATAS